jgi:hypothetical protein
LTAAKAEIVGEAFSLLVTEAITDGVLGSLQPVTPLLGLRRDVGILPRLVFEYQV